VVQSAAAGVGVVGLNVAGVSEAATLGAVRGPLPYKAIFDTRFATSRSFAVGAARLGCPTRSIAGDVTALWFNELQPHWARGGGAIVGMTTDHSLFCLEQLAWDHWLRVVARIEHRTESDGTTRHRLFLHGTALEETRAALAGNARWPERLAAPLVNQLQFESFARTAERVTVTSRPSCRDRSASLVSWVIAA
jgi:hypothetical protein